MKHTVGSLICSVLLIYTNTHTHTWRDGEGEKREATHISEISNQGSTSSLSHLLLSLRFGLAAAAAVPLCTSASAAAAATTQSNWFDWTWLSHCWVCCMGRGGLEWKGGRGPPPLFPFLWLPPVDWIMLLQLIAGDGRMSRRRRRRRLQSAKQNKKGGDVTQHPERDKEGQTCAASTAAFFIPNSNCPSIFDTHLPAPVSSSRKMLSSAWTAIFKFFWTTSGRSDWPFSSNRIRHFNLQPKKKKKTKKKKD